MLRVACTPFFLKEPHWCAMFHFTNNKDSTRVIFVLLTSLIFISSISSASIDKSNSQTTTQNTVSQDKIVKIDFIVDNQQVTDSNELRNLEELTYLSVGSLFSRHAIQQSVISLYSVQEYSQIDVYTVDTKQGKTLIFKIQSVMEIKRRSITGVASEELNRSLQNVLRLKQGDMYFREVAETDLKSIKRVCENHGYFGVQVDIKTDTTKGSLTYQITLGNPTYITQFQIQGNSAIFSEHIKEVCNSQIGKIYMKSTINEDFTAIRSLYRKRYYPDIKINPDIDNQLGILTYVIQERKQLLLDFVDVKGKPILQDSFISKLIANLQLNREESERNKLRGKIERYINNESEWIKIVQTHYQQKGYYGTEVTTKTLTNSPLHVEFTIRPGKRYIVKSVEFMGNEAFTREELLREMETKPTNFLSRYIRKRFFSELTLEKDNNRMEILYEKSGYPNVKIISTIDRLNSKNGKGGEVTIKLSIVEPYKEVIYRCSFQGNSVLVDNTLNNVLPNKFPQPNAKLVQKNNENAILKAYNDSGYIDAEVVETQFFHKYVTPSFEIEGDFAEFLNAGTLSNEIKKAFQKHNLSLTGMHIATRIDEEWGIQDIKGNVRYALLQNKELLSVYEYGILQFTISEGDKIEFGQFIFDEDLGVYPSILTREVSHLTGTLFTPNKLNQARQNIFNTRIFEPGITYRRSIPMNTDEQDNSLDDSQPSNLSPNHTVVNDVSFNLQKRKPGSYGASVGVSSSDGPRGTISLNHLNLFRRNIRFQLRGRWGFRAYLYDTTITEPWLIGRTSGSIHFLGRKLEEDDGVRALQSSFSISKKLPAAHRLNLEYSFRFLNDTSLEETDPELSTTVSSVRFLWRQDTQFPSLNPVSGMLNEVTLEYAGGILGGRSSFVKTVAESIYHQQLNDSGYVLSSSLRLGLTTGLQRNRESELISFERFWAGGSTTVRGYEERGLGPEDTTGKHRGNVLFIFNTELRFTILDPFQGILFLDTGNVWGTFEEINYTWMPTSVGVGLRLNLGPFVGGVDYAVPLISVPDVPTNSLYFRIGSTF